MFLTCHTVQKGGLFGFAIMTSRGRGMILDPLDMNKVDTVYYYYHSIMKRICFLVLHHHGLLIPYYCTIKISA